MHLLRSSALIVVGALLVGAPAAAQVIVSPDTVAVTLAEGDTAEVTLAVSRAAPDTAAFALSLAPAPSADDPPEPPGTLLFATEPEVLSFDPFDLTMTPDGRLFGAEPDGRNRTVELTPSLAVVREFEHPTTAFLSLTGGIAFDGDGGDSTLWWLDLQGDGTQTEQALLLEGTLDGVATGRAITVPFALTGRCGWTVGRPFSPVYEPNAEGAGSEALFYYLDVWNNTVAAIDTLGRLADGYPVWQTDYAARPSPSNEEGCLIDSGLDAHRLGGEPVLEVLTGYPFVHPQNRAYTVVVTDREGRNRGAETPLFDLPPPDGFGSVLRLYGVVRSRLDPSVMYLTALTGFPGAFRDWVLAVRAAPLPPVWLHGSPILFETEGTADTTLTLTLDATGLAPGVYEAIASVREGDGIGPVVAEVPVTLTVPTVDAEDEAPEQIMLELGAPYPNPASESVAVPLVLPQATETHVAVYDVLGRRVATLAEGPLAAGRHELVLDGAALPAGVYLVRADAGAGQVLTRRFTVAR